MEAVQKIAGLPLSEAVCRKLPGVHVATSLIPVARFVASWNFMCRGHEIVRFLDVEDVDGQLLQDLRVIV